ncbi:Nuclear fragile X mental retardation-interacting protein 2 [Bagarius yarrelli]|uniref:Nuclear fragile X mental retardation-interacting protein 2 n=1 Tax=Bagarius yarrelli TaxID=175774 RepID=A0A556U3J3_BAGYA|nr:Nuclear fragile X mental retardation-interacting protein 2 [Bagarius yarrelli]
MDENQPASVFKHYKVKNMHEKEAALTLNGEVILSSSYITNGYSGKLADNDGSGSESGYMTPKKRRARRSSVKGIENTSREKDKSAKHYSKQDAETLGTEMSGKTLHAQLNCTGTCVKAELHTGVRRTGTQDASPVTEVQHRNSDGKTAVSFVAKKTDDKASKTKPVSSKEDSWTLFKPPPVFPVDNSSAKIVPKISYASKVKENLNVTAAQASAEMTQMSGNPANVPMSAVKTVTSASFTDNPANGCCSVETPFNSAASANQAEDDLGSSLNNGCSSPLCLSTSDPLKSNIFVYPHKPLNMQPSAAQTGQKALGDIFQNQWGLSFINEPNAGPDRAPVSRLAVPFEISDFSFQGGNVPFLIRPSPNVVSLPSPQDALRKNYVSNVVMKQCPTSRTASKDRPQAESAHLEEHKVEHGSSDLPFENLDAESMRNSLLKGLPKTHAVKAGGWGWADFQAAIRYHTKEFEDLLTLHKQDHIPTLLASWRQIYRLAWSVSDEVNECSAMDGDGSAATSGSPSDTQHDPGDCRGASGYVGLDTLHTLQLSSMLGCATADTQQLAVEKQVYRLAKSECQKNDDLFPLRFAAATKPGCVFNPFRCHGAGLLQSVL